MVHNWILWSSPPLAILGCAVTIGPVRSNQTFTRMGANPHRGESEGQVGEGREDGAEGMEAKQK